MGLELGELAADRRQGRAEPAGGGGQAAGLDHGGQHGHGVEPIHDSSNF